MRRECLFHFVGPELKRFQQVAVPPLKVIQYVRQLAGRGVRIELENPLDDMVGASLVGRVQIARFGCRLERTHDHARGLGTQIECLPVQKSRLRQGALGSQE